MSFEDAVERLPSYAVFTRQFCSAITTCCYVPSIQSGHYLTELPFRLTARFKAIFQPNILKTAAHSTACSSSSKLTLVLAISGALAPSSLMTTLVIFGCHAHFCFPTEPEYSPQLVYTNASTTPAPPLAATQCRLIATAPRLTPKAILPRT